MKKIYHMCPLYESFIWGGRKIIDRYHLNTDLNNVGIMYHVIAIPGKLDCIVEETQEPLSVFYKNHKELFACASELFPVRMTTSCGENKMSYHLHPSDAYALVHEGTRGKASGAVAMEEADKVSERLFGNRAQTVDEFKKMVQEKDWDHLFQKISVKQGDFLHTPAGVIHGGGGEGTMNMTFSTNSDITYRFYDYDRNDPKRKLHLQQVYDCVNIPEVSLGTVHPEPKLIDGLQTVTYHDFPGEYTAMRLDVHGSGIFEKAEFYFLFCADGDGTIGDTEISEGKTVFVPADYGKVDMTGNMRLYLISYRDAVGEG